MNAPRAILKILVVSALIASDIFIHWDQFVATAARHSHALRASIAIFFPIVSGYSVYKQSASKGSIASTMNTVISYINHCLSPFWGSCGSPSSWLILPLFLKDGYVERNEKTLWISVMKLNQTLCVLNHMYHHFCAIQHISPQTGPL